MREWMDSDTVFVTGAGEPFPTPVVSVDPAYQEMYQAWAERRDAEPLTLAEKLGAVKARADANMQITAMSITMIAVCIVLKIVFLRIASKRRALASRMSASAWGRVTSVRCVSNGRQRSYLAAVEYEYGELMHSGEFLLGYWKSHKEGDTVKVLFDPHDPDVSMLGESKLPTGREFDAVLIPLFAIGVAALLWILL